MRLRQLKAPQWILTRPNLNISEGVRKFFTYFPFVFTILQTIGFALIEAFFPLLGHKIPAMAKAGLKRYDVPEKYHSLLTPSVCFFLSCYLQWLTILEYTPGCKRLVFATEYLQCLKTPKLELVQDEIVALSETTVITESGKEYACDVLILCHGFKADTFNYPLRGRNGITPEQHWTVAGGPSCYKGSAMNGFPNFFSIRGPNMASAQVLLSSLRRLFSVIHFMESTRALILNVAGPLIKGKVDVVEVNSEAEQAYVQRVQKACRDGFWGRDCTTYYVTKNGWNHTMYPWSKS